MSEEYATKVMSASATYANITMTALMQKSNSIIAPPHTGNICKHPSVQSEAGMAASQEAVSGLVSDGRCKRVQECGQCNMGSI